MSAIPALGALQNPGYRRLWLVALTGGLSIGATVTTLGWVVVEASGSPLVVSLVLVTFLGPQVIAGPVGGVLADRYGRAGLIRIGIATRAGLSLLLALSLTLAPTALAPLFVIATLRSLAAGATIPSRRALMADIVPPRLLTNALALDELGLTLVLIVGPVITGALLVLVEPQFIFVGLAGISLAAVALVPQTREASETRDGSAAAAARPALVREMVEGFHYVKRSRALLAVTIVSLAAEMLAFNYLTLVPVFAKEVFNGGSGLLGLLNGTMPVGELVGAGAMAALAARVTRPGRLLTIGVAAVFAVGIPLGMSTWLPLTLLLLVALGGLGQVFFVNASTMLLREAPVEVRARVLGLQQVTWGAGALGGVISGLVASAIDPHMGVVIPSAIGLATVLAVAVAFPELRSAGRIEPVEQQPGEPSSAPAS